MKILCISSHDATNFRLANVIEEFLARGNEVLFYQGIAGHNNIRMFSGFMDKMKVIDTISAEQMEEIDFVFCGNEGVIHVIEYDTYIFRYDILGWGCQIGDGGDFVFAMGNTQRYDIPLQVPMMRIGNPMYDHYQNYRKTQTVYKRFLFIDSGHFPFGKDGKQVLAHLLLQICHQFPEYELVIKPRFLPGEENVTHINQNHLYRNIKEACGGQYPPNLTLLKEHKEMEELIKQCDTVICLYTGAYLDAAVMGKNLLILGNLPNEDSLDLNGYHWDCARNVVKETGCLVDYREAIRYLPEGLVCSPDHIANELSYRSGVSEKIVTAVEIIYEKYVKKKNYPAPGIYDFEQLQAGMAFEAFSRWEEVKNLRLYNMQMYRITRRRDPICHNMDIQPLLDKLDQMRVGLELSEIGAAKLDVWVDQEFDQIIVSNQNLLMGSHIQQAFFMEALFYSNPDGLWQLFEAHFFNTRALAYFQGRTYVRYAKYGEALHCFERHLKESQPIDFYQYPTDTHRYLSSSMYHLGLCYAKMHQYEKALDWLSECIAYEKGNHRRAKEMMDEIRKLALPQKD